MVIFFISRAVTQVWQTELVGNRFDWIFKNTECLAQLLLIHWAPASETLGRVSLLCG